MKKLIALGCESEKGKAAAATLTASGIARLGAGPASSRRATSDCQQEQRATPLQGHPSHPVTLSRSLPTLSACLFSKFRRL
jgi:hypothetical protein